MGEEKDVKLFKTWSTSFGLRITWALKLKGIDHQSIDEDLSNKSALLLKYNPIHKKVPVLLHNGNPIVESVVILEYIDETWKENPILPGDPYERAMARFMARFGDDKCLPAIWGVFTTQGKERDAAAVEAIDSLRTLEDWLKGKRYFNGEKMGFTDIMLGWIANLVGVFEEVMDFKIIDEDRFPLLCKWMENFSSLPVINSSWPPRDRLLVKYHALHDTLVGSAGPK